MMFPYVFSFSMDGWLSFAIDIVAKSSVLLILAAIACWLLRGRSAAVRHRVWTLALAGSVAVPVVSVVGPQFSVPLPVRQPGLQESGPSMSGRINNDERWRRDFSVSNLESDDSVSAAVAQGSAEGRPAANSVAAKIGVDEPIRKTAEFATDIHRIWPEALLLIWVAGFSLRMMRLIAAVTVQRRRIDEMAEMEDAGWNSSVSFIARQLGVRRAVSTRQSQATSVPMTYGVFRSVIVVPADWQKWSDEHRGCVLSHELAHVMRHDVAIQLFARMVVSFYWFNPLVWFAANRLRIEREFACDDAVLISGRRPSDYADTLLKTLSECRQKPVGVGVAMADSARLDCRVEAILDDKRERRSPGRFFRFFLTVSAICSVSVIGGAAITTIASQSQVTQSAQDSDVPLSRTIMIRGIVIGPDAQPISDAELYLSVSEHRDSIRLGRSNADGTFQLEVPRETLTRTVGAGVALGQCKASLLAVADGAGAAWEFLPSVNGGRFGAMKPSYEVRLQMVEDLPVRGRIVDNSGVPVAGAIVSVDTIHELRGRMWYKMLPAIETLDVDSMTQREINANRWFSYMYPGAPGIVRATTDASGHFTLTGLGSNRAVRLRVSGPGFRSPPAFSVLVREDASEFAQRVRDKYPPKGQGNGIRLFGIHPVIAVERAVSVAGTVRDAVTGAPVESAEVYVLGGTPERTARLDRVWTDSQGRYRFVLSDPQAEFTVVVDGDPHLHLPASRTFRNVNGVGEITADFEIPHGALIRGRVVEMNSDRPIAAEHRDFCEDIQPGPLLSGHAWYYPLQNNQWLRDLGQGLVSIPFEYSQTNHRRRVYIDKDGEFQMAVPPGPGIVLIDATPPRGEPRIISVPKVPYLTVGGKVTGTTLTTEPGGLSFPGMQKPIPVDHCHAWKLIDPGSVEEQIDLRIEVQPAPSQAIRFVNPDGQPIAGMQVHGLLPRDRYGRIHGLGIPDFESVAYGVSAGEQRRIVAISNDGKFGVATSISGIRDSPVIITMQPTASLKFRMVDRATAKPLAGYRFRTEYGAYSRDKLHLRIAAQEAFATDEHGEVQITTIVPGESFTLNVIPPSRAPKVKLPKELTGLTLSPGELRNLDAVRVEPAKARK